MILDQRCAPGERRQTGAARVPPTRLSLCKMKAIPFPVGFPQINPSPGSPGSASQDLPGALDLVETVRSSPRLIFGDRRGHPGLTGGVTKGARLFVIAGLSAMAAG